MPQYKFSGRIRKEYFPIFTDDNDGIGIFLQYFEQVGLDFVYFLCILLQFLL